MKLYMISNRLVIQEGGKERFQNVGKERAQNSFRVATCELKGNSVEYEILPDKMEADYDYMVDKIKQELPDARTPEADDDRKALGDALGKVDRDNLHGTAKMFYDLYTDMVEDTSNKGDVLFFIHGFANKLEDNLEHINRLHKLYLAPANSPVKHMIYVSWPTFGRLFGKYKDDQKDAVRTGRILGKIYEDLQHFFDHLFEELNLYRCRHKIHLAAHSMGNQVLREMLEFMPVQRLNSMFGEVLLLHADVEDDVFEPSKTFNKLEPLADRVHIYIHKGDDALRISRFTKNFNKRLGQKGPKHLKNLNDETFVVDTTKTKGKSPIKEEIVDHWGYMHKQELIDDIIHVLNGVDAAEIEERTPKGSSGKYFQL